MVTFLQRLNFCRTAENAQDEFACRPCLTYVMDMLTSGFVSCMIWEPCCWSRWRHMPLSACDTGSAPATPHRDENVATRPKQNSGANGSSRMLVQRTRGQNVLSSVTGIALPRRYCRCSISRQCNDFAARTHEVPRQQCLVLQTLAVLLDIPIALQSQLERFPGNMDGPG